uniref:Uncharacterized protein n=1 Tax=Arundo donax TaxID=35708 RepID=A0A0A8ZRD6_ARUDO
MSNCCVVIQILDKCEELQPLCAAKRLLRDLVRNSYQAQASLLVTYWRQRGKIRRCRLGDENTSFPSQCYCQITTESDQGPRSGWYSGVQSRQQRKGPSRFLQESAWVSAAYICSV